MKTSLKTILTLSILIAMIGCNENPKEKMTIKAADILGNAEYLAISYGGYRQASRDIQPTIPELKEDMKLLAAMGIKILRTYNVQLQQAPNLLKAISQLKKEDSNFEMYVMLGAWIDCENAWTETPNHEAESKANTAEIDRAVALAKAYPNIVKIIAVGNEAMVRWATSYFVRPHIILKWVNHLQALKKSGELSKDLWITSSDDFSSWGGGDPGYHTPDLENLIKAVDYISMHTYPMHNSYYHPSFWVVPENDMALSDIEKIEAAMLRAKTFAVNQYQEVSKYMKSLGVNKPIHIGETGWATVSNGHYGANSSRAADEYKAGRYYQLMREWTNEAKISCFYFEAFNEQWKDHRNKKGSENHFGLINLQGQAKYALWDLVDKGIFNGLTRDGQEITKTYNGEIEALMKEVLVPPMVHETISH
ncbi:glycosyl hydrolase family 17 protein [Flavivirga sp. 57AJ16]|uniref:glycosyl hydrolase family 17 protein n=1 Tax=Flavivirga sp. 57AJ16 TaxID=3025307 RepID=UPI0023670601|nr:glycosyl hydrolase family 17 protein [Flavivirga sp. 57AJ16]MDD7885954.1 glycosyl hydrolase family 17 protein [Flavivirga sp. 57AJ16]